MTDRDRHMETAEYDTRRLPAVISVREQGMIRYMRDRFASWRDALERLEEAASALLNTCNNDKHRIGYDQAVTHSHEDWAEEMLTAEVERARKMLALETAR